MISELEEKMVGELLPIRDRLHEMEVRRIYSLAEMIGHFCNELRRTYILQPLADVKLWRAPFTPYETWWPRPIVFRGESITLLQKDMVSVCRKVLSMNDDDIALTRQLDSLEKQLPNLVGKSVEIERLTRKTVELFTEATAFAAQQEYTA